MTRTATHALRFLADNGMLLVLLLLCLAFSALTFREQSPEGETAAAQVAVNILESGNGTRVLIVASAYGEDPLFVTELRHRLEDGGAVIVGTVQGEPRDARPVLRELARSGDRLEAIACSSTTASWQLITDRGSVFPPLAAVPVVAPGRYWWPTFLKRSNLLNIANQITVIAIVAIGMTMVIITGGIDLSVGSLIALSAMVTALLIEASGALSATSVDMVLSCLAGIAVCGLIGLLSGVIITRFQVPPFIVTLAMMMVASGTAFRLTDGASVSAIPPSFMWLGSGADLLRLPNAAVLMLLLYGLANVLMTRTTLGRYLYAVGGNAEAARLSGVPVQAVLLFAYVFSGMMAGLGGVIMASQLKSASPNYGKEYELSVIAAVVVGGTSLSGGEGRMFGTLVGVFIIAVIQNGMNLANLNTFTQKIVLGLLILAAVLLDRLKQRLWQN
jgi:ribose transport system permease protein